MPDWFLEQVSAQQGLFGVGCIFVIAGLGWLLRRAMGRTDELAEQLRQSQEARIDELKRSQELYAENTAAMQHATYVLQEVVKNQEKAEHREWSGIDRRRGGS